MTQYNLRTHYFGTFLSLSGRSALWFIEKPTSESLIFKIFYHVSDGCYSRHVPSLSVHRRCGSAWTSRVSHPNAPALLLKKGRRPTRRSHAMGKLLPTLLGARLGLDPVGCSFPEWSLLLARAGPALSFSSTCLSPRPGLRVNIEVDLDSLSVYRDEECPFTRALIRALTSHS